MKKFGFLSLVEFYQSLFSLLKVNKQKARGKKQTLTENFESLLYVFDSLYIESNKTYFFNSIIYAWLKYLNK